MGDHALGRRARAAVFVRGAGAAAIGAAVLVVAQEGSDPKEEQRRHDGEHDDIGWAHGTPSPAFVQAV